MNGGYIMIYKNSKRIYLELFACLTLGKPILWYEDKNTCFFIDTISGGEISTEIVDDEEVRTYGDIILTKGGMTITITAENVVSEVGEIQPSSGSSVVANPTLSGDEEDLTGLEVDGVKYAVASSGGLTLYNHQIKLFTSLGVATIISIINTTSTKFSTPSQIASILYQNRFTDTSAFYSCQCRLISGNKFCKSVFAPNNSTLKVFIQNATDDLGEEQTVTSIVDNGSLPIQL